MSIEELLQLNPRHLAELRDLYFGFPFDEVEIAAQETTLFEDTEEPRTLGFACVFRKIQFDSIVCGKNHSHAIFVVPGEDNTFYYVSFARVGQLESRVIFKLIRKGVTL